MAWQAAPVGGVPWNRGNGSSEGSGALGQLCGAVCGHHQPGAVLLVDGAD